MSTLHSYWSGALRRLQAEVDGFAQLVKHHGEQGRENEFALARLLTSLVPTRFGTGSGLLIDSYDSQSPQTDVIVYEQAMEASLFAQTSQLLYPIESCYAAIEVKTTVTAEDVVEFGANAARLSALRSLRDHVDGTTRPISCLFAYSAWAKPRTVLKHLIQLAEPARPDLFCVVDAGCVGGRSEVLRWDSATTGVYSAGQTFLYKSTDEGQRRQLSTERLYETIGHTTYTVFRVNRDESFLVDSARALLVFLEALLRQIHNKADGRTSVLSLYLTEDIGRVDFVDVGDDGQELVRS